MGFKNSQQNETKRRLPGRPKKGIKRSEVIMVRLTPTERLLIENKAKKAGLKISEWFRKAAKQAEVVARISVQEANWFRILAGMANNLNQLTRQSHVYGLALIEKDLKQMLDKIENLLNRS
ncbi:plasmid mobilization protein [Solitalea lacus]|uniref:plasmid mobilization protein n=1 Tax=Solitalea lacus TaxID=2911172 RepID=UPI001EDBF72C|nr:plasmid mobilization relaxosome protein MobC [Solitalea lacus]UKJ09187.1 MobC family plasmid mobilization relaxosome protein [Solitalea lacus]